MSEDRMRFVKISKVWRIDPKNGNRWVLICDGNGAYHIREILKQLGFRWDRVFKEWTKEYYNDDIEAINEAIKNFIKANKLKNIRLIE